jgi:hypothetical protein
MAKTENFILDPPSLHPLITAIGLKEKQLGVRSLDYLGRSKKTARQRMFNAKQKFSLSKRFSCVVPKSFA